MSAEWSDLVRERTKVIHELANDRMEEIWRTLAGGLTSGLAVAVVAYPSWPLAFALFVFAGVWMYLRTLQHQTLTAVLQDEDTVELVNSVLDRCMELTKRVEGMENKHAALSNRLGSHTGISLSPSESSRPFTRLPKGPR